MFYVLIYLVSIVAANLLVTIFGPWISIVNAFLFIGLDLVARDKLHDIWSGNKLFLKMSALIAFGSILSYALNRNAGIIAIASFIAFLSTGFVDTVIYHILRKRRWIIRSNWSNVISAGVDSVVFPTIAFGQFLPIIILGQWLAKVFGGAIWSLVILRFREKV